MGTSTKEPDRFESWKQIAAYLSKSERTVRRWHELEGLPIHKHQHRERGSVWAYRTELDRWLAGRTLGPELEPKTIASPAKRRKWPLVAGLGSIIVAVVIVLIAGPWNRIDRLAGGVPLTTLPGAEYGASFSPDGKRVVFHWSRPNRVQNGLYVKEIGKDSVTPLVVSTDQPVFIYSPAWSPDGTTIAFLERTSSGETWLCTTAVSGGPRRRLRQLAAAPVLFFGNHQHVSWMRDSQAVVVPLAMNDERGIYRISVQTGDAVAITRADSAYAPALSPDGRRLAWLRREGLPIAFEQILLTRLKPDGTADGAPLILYKGHSVSSGIAWTADSRSLFLCNDRSGELIGSSGSRLFRLSASAPAEPIEIGGDGCTTVAVTPTGVVVVGTSMNARATMQRVSLQAPGAQQELVSSSRYDSNPTFSPDGEKIAFHSSRSGQPEIWIVHRDGTGLRRLTENSNVRTGPAWSPANDEIVYATGRDLVISTLTGSVVSRIEVAGEVVQNPVWSSDGRTIYYTAGTHLCSTLRDARERKVLRELPEILALAKSYDGKYLYYLRPGHPFILGRVPVGGGPEEIVEDGIALPCFAISRRSAYLIRKDLAVYALPLRGGPARKAAGVPRFNAAGQNTWDTRIAVAPDDSTFVWVNRSAQEVDLEMWKPQRSGIGRYLRAPAR